MIFVNFRFSMLSDNINEILEDYGRHSLSYIPLYIYTKMAVQVCELCSFYKYAMLFYTLPRELLKF
jgi:hypothetical protein